MILQILIIEGETGSGKTTQIPQYLCEAVSELYRICYNASLASAWMTTVQNYDVYLDLFCIDTYSLLNSRITIMHACSDTLLLHVFCPPSHW